jgi:RNA polymerase sigma-70 factor (ECF subfamily)
MAWFGNPDPSGVRSVGNAGDFAAFLETGISDRAAWPDELLMQAIVTRDEAAFAALYDRYADLVYSAALRILGDPGLAQDATQDIFVRLWRRPEGFVPGRGRFLSWFMSVARNRAVDELRARGRRQRREGVPGPAEDALLMATPDTVDDPATTAALHDDQAAVRVALAGLPREQRTALQLAYFGGLTQQEIAERLGEPLGTVKTRIRLGMQKLRRALDGRQ